MTFPIRRIPSLPNAIRPMGIHTDPTFGTRRKVVMANGVPYYQSSGRSNTKGFGRKESGSWWPFSGIEPDGKKWADHLPKNWWMKGPGFGEHPEGAPAHAMDWKVNKPNQINDMIQSHSEQLDDHDWHEFEDEKQLNDSLTANGWDVPMRGEYPEPEPEQPQWGQDDIRWQGSDVQNGMAMELAWRLLKDDDDEKEFSLSDLFGTNEEIKEEMRLERERRVAHEERRREKEERREKIRQGELPRPFAMHTQQELEGMTIQGWSDDEDGNSHFVDDEETRQQIFDEMNIRGGIEGEDIQDNINSTVLENHINRWGTPEGLSSMDSDERQGWQEKNAGEPMDIAYRLLKARQTKLYNWIQDYPGKDPVQQMSAQPSQFKDNYLEGEYPDEFWSFIGDNPEDTESHGASRHRSDEEGNYLAVGVRGEQPIGDVPTRGPARNIKDGGGVRVVGKKDMPDPDDIVVMPKNASHMSNFDPKQKGQFRSSRVRITQ